MLTHDMQALQKVTGELAAARAESREHTHALNRAIGTASRLGRISHLGMELMGSLGTDDVGTPQTSPSRTNVTLATPQPSWTEFTDGCRTSGK